MDDTLKVGLVATGLAVGGGYLLWRLQKRCYVQGKPVPCRLVKIPNTKKMKARGDAVQAFVRMSNDAFVRQGLNLRVNSAFRTQAKQTTLYAAHQACKLAAIGTLGLVKCDPVAKPGWSRHQSGVALDIQSGAETRKAWKASGRPMRRGTTKAYAWMVQNARRYGFRRTVASEPWHWVWSA